MFELQRFAQETLVDPNDVKVSYSRFKETLDQKNQIEQELAAYRQRFGDLNAQQNYQQPPPIQSLTEDKIKTFEDAINYGAKQLSGFSDEQVDELSYLDDDDPRIKLYNYAKRIAENAVYNNYITEQVALQQKFQRYVFRRRIILRRTNFSILKATSTSIR